MRIANHYIVWVAAFRPEVVSPNLPTELAKKSIALTDESVTQFFMLYNFLNDKLIYYIFASINVLMDEVGWILKQAQQED